MANFFIPSILRNLIFTFVPLDQLVEWYDQQREVASRSHFFSFDNCCQIVIMRYQTPIEQIQEYYDPFTRRNAHGDTLLLHPVQMIVKFGAYYREVCKTTLLYVNKEVALLLAIENEQSELVWHYCQYRIQITLPLIVAAINSGNAITLAIVLGYYHGFHIHMDRITGLTFNHATARVFYNYAKTTKFNLAESFYLYICGAGLITDVANVLDVRKMYFLLGAYYHGHITIAELYKRSVKEQISEPIKNNLLNNLDPNALVLIRYNKLADILYHNLPIIIMEKHLAGAAQLLEYFLQHETDERLIKKLKLISGATITANDINANNVRDLALLLARIDVGWKEADYHDWLIDHVATIMAHPEYYLAAITIFQSPYWINIWFADQQRHATLMPELWRRMLIANERYSSYDDVIYYPDPLVLHTVLGTKPLLNSVVLSPIFSIQELRQWRKWFPHAFANAVAHKYELQVNIAELVTKHNKDVAKIISFYNDKILL